ncbi:hypothetical protein AB0M02_09200 [Actinoplanes sp. NPDC051861]|uniref:hypothetical protein n=1 Tax=Actinoplanes sp. NPDC051861 TaxID=3155170 RepID=UPI0034140FB0
MFEQGSRSKQVATFMLPADVAGFSDVVAEPIADLASWETHDRTAGVVLHNSLEEALQHNGVQAFLRLLGRDGGTVGPLIQFLHTSVFTGDEDLLAATGGRYRPLGGEGEKMEPGRLAFKWFPEDQADCVRRDFVTLADLAWKALQKVTSPHVTTVDGKPLRRYRVGPAAKAWALKHPECVLRDGGLVLKVKDGG